MKNTTLALLLILLPLCSHAQDSNVYYCRDRNCNDIVPQARAKFSQTVTHQGGVETTTITNLKTNEIESRIGKRGDEPMGIWITLAARGKQELDYDFEVQYDERKDCANKEELRSIDDLLKDNPAIGYTGPVVDEKDPTVMTFLKHNLRYPAVARRSGIQGTVQMVLEITEEGSVENIVVTEGVHIAIDKEAVRVFRKLKFESPAKLNGVPQRVCVEMPVRFQLM